MAGERERIVLATKYTGAMRGRDVNASGNSRKNMMESVHASLKRLGTDYIDLYWVHARDLHHADRRGDARPRRSRAPGQGALRRASRTRPPGRSRARTRSPSCAAGSRFVGLQIRYSLLDRTVERELLPMAKALDLTVTPWDTLGSGVLTGKYNRDALDAGARHAARRRSTSAISASRPRS